MKKSSSKKGLSERKVQYEAVDHPQHYRRGGIEAIDVIEAWQLDFHLGNTLKYLARAGNKPYTEEIEDLLKAKWYLDRKIQWLEGQRRSK